jgi:uncharacterized protein (DUF1697 family)
MSACAGYVALLRGINVGRANRVAMSDLRALAASLGYIEPRTLLNSGNLVFSAPKTRPADLAARLEDALSTVLAVSARVIVLSAEEFSLVARNDRVSAEATDPSRLLVAFPRDPSYMRRLEPLVGRDWSPENLTLGERVAYAWCPHGVTGSGLLASVGRALGDSVTTRNWATVLKIQAMMVTWTEIEIRTGGDCGEPGR